MAVTPTTLNGNARDIFEIKQRVTKAASEGLSKIANSKHLSKTQQDIVATTNEIRPNSLWSFNSLADNLFIVSNVATTLPITTQEQLIIRELLYCLVGIRGTYILPEIDANGSIEFKLSDQIHMSLQDIVKEILPLAVYYSRVQTFIQKSNSDNTLQALSAALRYLMHDYYMSIVQLETQLTCHSLSLQKLLFFLRPTMNIFEILDDVLQPIIHMEIKGAKVLSFLYDKITTLTGDIASQKIIIHLVERTAGPYIEMLQLWIQKGVIVDPYHEFLVEDNEIVHCDVSNLNHYSAEYWEKRYTIRLDCVPRFLEGLADIILRTGKYLNVIRQCGNQIQPLPIEQLKFMPNNTGNLVRNINDAYKRSSRTLLEVLVKDNDLMGHLLSVKRYLLLHQGDFINQFMDAGEKELTKNVDKVLPMKLENLLGLTLRLSSTKYDPYKDDLHCQLFPFELVKQMSKIHLVGCTIDEYWKNNNNINLTGLQCFAFRYDVRWPISLVLNHFAILEYQMLFRQLFLCKHVERQLCKVWKDNNNTKKFAPDAAELYRCAFILRQRMMNAIQNVEYYMMIEVIEPTWHNFVEKIGKVENVDDVLTVHQDFLDDCLYNCMLKSPDLLRSVVKLCDICLNFCKFIQKAQQYFIYAELTSMLCSDESSESDSDIDILSNKQSESSLAPSDTFSEQIKRFDLEFTFVLIGLLKQINELFHENPSSKLINLVHRINFNSFYNDQLEKISCKDTKASSYAAHM